MKNIIKNTKGLTIVEMVVYIGLFCIIILILVQIFFMFINQKNISSSKSFVHQDFNYLLLKFKHDINNSEQLLYPNNAGQQTSNLQILKNQDTFEYFLQNGNLILSNSQGEFILNNNNNIISDLYFTKQSNQSNPSVLIQFKISSRSNQNNEYINFSTSIGVR